MTPDLIKAIIVGSLSVFFTALFAGIPGVALFWWTYMRDQERLLVEKRGPRGLTSGLKTVLSMHQPSSVLEIVIRNRSLFSVHIMAVGFEVDGEVITAEHPVFPAKMKRNPDPLSNRHFIVDEDADPFEIPSQMSSRVSLSNSTDRQRFVVALLSAAEKRGVSVENILYGPKVIAMVSTETGKLFTSQSVRQQVYRWLLRIKKEMDGMPPVSEETM